MNSLPRTARLFVALPLPRPVTRRLAAIAPAAQTGVRLVAPSDLHATLHFLGTAEVAPVREALGSVSVPPLTIRLDRPGHFSPKGKKTVLWVGIEPSAALSGLHRATARALESVGFEPEKRAWHPHITLARLDRRAPARLVEAFEGRSLAAAAGEFECSRFALFESRTHPEGARYRVLETFPLEA